MSTLNTARYSCVSAIPEVQVRLYAHLDARRCLRRRCNTHLRLNPPPHTYLPEMCTRSRTDDTREAVAGPGICAAWRLAARSRVAAGQHWPALQLQAGSAGTAPGMPHRAQPRAAGPARRRRSRIVLNFAVVYSISVVCTRVRQFTALVFKMPNLQAKKQALPVPGGACCPGACYHQR